MKSRLKGFVYFLLTVTLPLTAQNISVKGPDGKLQVTVTCNENNKMCYTVSYNGKQLLEPSPLGLETNIGDFT